MIDSLDGGLNYHQSQLVDMAGQRYQAISERLVCIMFQLGQRGWARRVREIVLKPGKRTALLLHQGFERAWSPLPTTGYRAAAIQSGMFWLSIHCQLMEAVHGRNDP